MQKNALLNAVLLPGVLVLIVAAIIASVVFMENKLSKRSEISRQLMNTDDYSAMEIRTNDEISDAAQQAAQQNKVAEPVEPSLAKGTN